MRINAPCPPSPYPPKGVHDSRRLACTVSRRVGLRRALCSDLRIGGIAGEFP